jgi:hypothetical protein
VQKTSKEREIMSEYDNTNRGSIWKNERKTTDKHPDFTGSLDVEGKEYWVSAWKRKEGASAKAPSLSFSIKPKDDDGTGHRDGQGGASSTNDDFDDNDIPW